MQLVADFRKFTVLMSYCSQAVTHIRCIVERVTRLPGHNRGSGAYGAAVRRREPNRELNLHCLLGSRTYLTQMVEHGFALHLKNASGHGPC